MDYRYSFIDLFNKEVDFDRNTKVKVSSIVIPKIQRPYAQGRSDGLCTYVRNTFLDEIFESLTNDDEEILDLNFIYGIIKPNNDEYKLELLDGQQRLTTLFLLYWYIANAELETGSQEDDFIRNCLSHFLYETRATSTVFCQELASYKVKMEEKTPKEVIRNSKWYFKSFDRDSTISAMLTMLDAIHERYTSLEGTKLFGKLQKLQFYVKSLGLFNLSEELYIKMNARGLQLSPFENFKADLVNFISNKKYGKYQELVSLYKKDSNDKIPFHLNFSIKLDAKWVDLFWKNGAEDFDDAFMSFFSRFFACKYIIASKNSVSDREMRTDKNIKNFYTNAEEQIGTNEYFGFKTYEALLDSHPEYILTLDKVLDALYQYDYLSEEKCITHQLLPAWEKTKDNDGDDFYCNTSAKMSHIKLIALSAVIEYIEAIRFDIVTFAQWMRVVWNVIENTNIDSLTPVSSLVRKFSTVIHFIAKNMEDGKSFYSLLSEWHNDKSSDRENRALLEEIEKARRISEDSSWENVWKDIENHPYLKGMVTFFYTPSMSQEEYLHSAQLAKDMFNENGISPIYKDKHILIRSIISQFNTWNEIDQLYITERAERNKYLKNILASNEKVRLMLTDVLRKKNVEDVKSALCSYIDNADEPQAWQNADENDVLYFNLAIKRLRNDIKMYDWISKEEISKNASFRVCWYEGHIMLAIPRRQYAKIALDTERGKMAYSLSTDYGFEFDDVNQEDMWKEFKDCFGNYVWLKQNRKNCCVWVGFDKFHELKIEIDCQTKKIAKELCDIFEDSSIDEEENRLLYLPSMNHSTKARTYKKLCNVIEDIFEEIPELK